MTTVDDYAALGRLEGAGHAKAMFANCLGAYASHLRKFGTVKTFSEVETVFGESFFNF